MAGSNKAMEFVTNVAQNLDGTIGSPIPYAWSCPDVDSNSPVYFYAVCLFHQFKISSLTSRPQFSNNGNATETIYSQRFTIASPTGETKPAEHDTQPDGQPTPWGSGHISDKATPSAPPAPSASAPASTPAPPKAAAPEAKPPASIPHVRRRKCSQRYCRYAESRV